MNLFARFTKPTHVPTAEDALVGRPEPIATAERHAVNGRPLKGPWPGMESAVFAMGCFWGAERLFWQMDGVHVTAVGYIGGPTPNPTYRGVCSGNTGQTEGVLVVYDPARVSFADLTRAFFEGHDPTQGMRQGNDTGTQYRSGIYVYDDAQRTEAEAIKGAYEKALQAKGMGPITTEIVNKPDFYYAEDYHQQYLAKNPAGYCGLGGTGVAFD